MDYKETHINFLYNDLIKEYGNEQGKQLYALMCKKFANLCEKEIKSENHEINEHVFERLLPTISMYLTLIENDFTQEEALVHILQRQLYRFGKKLYRVQSNNIFRTSLYKYTELCRNGFH